MRIAILGTGNIGTAMANGLIKSGRFHAPDIILTRRKIHLLDEMRKQGFVVQRDNREAVDPGDGVGRVWHRLLFARHPCRVTGWDRDRFPFRGCVGHCRPDGQRRGVAAARMGNHSEYEIDKVTAPRGCTIAGLNQMEHAGFSSAMIKGITVSADKASKLYTHSE